MAEIKNAKIESTNLGNEDHAIMTAWLYLTWDGAGQGFGGYALDSYDKSKDRRVGTAYGLEFIMAILRTLEVSNWEKLPGTVCRIEADHGKIYRLGHFLKDKWFDPAKLSEELANA